MIAITLMLTVATTAVAVDECADNALPLGTNTYVALREINDSFLRPESGRDNWSLFVPLL